MTLWNLMLRLYDFAKFSSVFQIVQYGIFEDLDSGIVLIRLLYLEITDCESVKT